MKSRHFFASLDQLHEMLLWIREEAAKMGFDSSELYKIELAAEEAIVNVIHHSYGNQKGKVEIAVDSLPDRLQITISDEGAPFNPLAKKTKKDLGAPLEEREMGGLGLFFIRKCLDEVSYQRKNNQNILTLIKKRI
jgi:serine/threonine-protein kinase RsbW